MTATYCLLVYDIPSRARIANPSKQLRRIGFRVNLSCWVLRKEDLPWNLLDELRLNSAVWHTIDFDPSEGEKVVALAAQSLASEVEGILQAARLRGVSLEEGMDDTSRYLTEADVKAYRRNMLAALSRARRLLRDVTQAAGRFGLTGKQTGASEVRYQVDAMRRATETKAHAYAELTRRAAGTAMSAAAEQNAIPAPILADYLEEATGESLNGLRAAFTAQEIDAIWGTTQ